MSEIIEPALTSEQVINQISQKVDLSDLGLDFRTAFTPIAKVIVELFESFSLKGLGSTLIYSAYTIYASIDPDDDYRVVEAVISYVLGASYRSNLISEQDNIIGSIEEAADKFEIEPRIEYISNGYLARSLKMTLNQVLIDY